MNKKVSYQYQDVLLKLYSDDIGTNPHGFKAMPMDITFQVTEDCNLACTYCYQHNKSHEKMTFNTAKAFIDNLFDGKYFNYIDKDVSGYIFDFIGGEPFLEIDLIDKITDYIKTKMIKRDHKCKNTYMISICTNGVLYKDPKVQEFIRKNRDILSITVTVDGNKELHDTCRIFPDGKGSYNLAYFAQMDLKVRGFRPGTKITLAPSNVNKYSECFIKMLKDGVDIIYSNCVYEAGWTKEHGKMLYDQTKIISDYMDKSGIDKKDIFSSMHDNFWGRPMPESENNNWCGGTGHMLSIGPDGSIYPCLRYMPSSIGNNQKPYKIGSVDKGIYTFKEEKERGDCIKCITRRSQSTDKCFYCPIATGCSWCSAYNYEVNGTPNSRVTNICIMHQARILGICYYWNTYFKKSGIEEHFDLWVPRKWAKDIIGDEEYDKLVSLTKELGGYVNEFDEEIRNYA